MQKHKIDLLREFVNYTCEACHKKEDEDEVGTLIPHRIRRGNDGGEYILRNILMVCKRCHKLIHSKEFI